MRAPVTRLVLAASLVVVSAPAFAQADFQWRGTLAAGQSVEIKGVSGDIRALAANTNEVEVTAAKSARRSNPADVRIEVVPSGSGVTICAVYPDVPGQEPNRCEAGSQWSSHTRDNDVVVNFTVRVPAGVNLIARTVNGKVEGESLQSDVDGSTVNGSVSLSTSGLARAKTVNGSITATMGKADWSNGAHFSSVNGSITLKVGSMLNAELQAETVNGTIESDFPIAMTGEFNRRRVRGTIGSGGQALRLSTVNGSIHLLKE